MTRYSVFILFIFFLVGCSKDASRPSFQTRPIPVAIFKAIERTIPIYFEAIGTISSPHIVDLTAQVNGKLLYVHVHSGEEVKAGQLLFTIEADSFEAVLAGAKAALERDQAQLAYLQNRLDRYRTLAQKDYISPLTLAQYSADVAVAQGQVAADEAEIQSAQINYDRCFIYSPIDGKISDILTDPGNLVGPEHPGAILTQIQQLAPINVRFKLTQSEYQRLQEQGPILGLPLEIFLPGQEKGRQGTVTFVDNSVDVASGTLLLKGTLENKDKILWPGEYAKVRLKIRTETDALLIPSHAIQRSQKGAYVFAVSEDNTVEVRQVKIGGQWQSFTIIIEGLKKDEVVVTDGQINLRSGKQVTLVSGSDE